MSRQVFVEIQLEVVDGKRTELRPFVQGYLPVLPDFPKPPTGLVFQHNGVLQKVAITAFERAVTVLHGDNGGSDDDLQLCSPISSDECDNLGESGGLGIILGQLQQSNLGGSTYVPRPYTEDDRERDQMRALGIDPASAIDIDAMALDTSSSDLIGGETTEGSPPDWEGEVDEDLIEPSEHHYNDALEWFDGVCFGRVLAGQESTGDERPNYASPYFCLGLNHGFNRQQTGS